MNKEVLEQMLLLDKKERLLSDIIAWLKSKNLWEECKKDLSIEITSE